MADPELKVLAREIDARCRLHGSFVLRKQAKAYGTARLAEGADPAGRTVTLVEDVITTGGAVAAAARALRDLGATVSTVVCAIDRSQRGQDPLAADDVRVLKVFTNDDLDFARG